jgi:hypothetical protein
MQFIRFVVLLGAATPAPLFAQGSGVRAAVHSITPAGVKQRISIIADDSMRGRFTPSPGLEKVASYIAGQFQSFGLKPGGDSGSFLQRYSVEAVRLDTAQARIAVQDGPTWRLGHEAVFQWGSGLAAGEVTGPTIVLTGLPPAKPPVELGLKGSIVVLVPGVTPRGLPVPETNLLAPVLVRGGVAALIVVAPIPDSMWAAMGQMQLRPVTRYPWNDIPPIIRVRDAAIAPVLAQRGLGLAALRRAADQPFKETPVPDLKLSVDLRHRVLESVSAPNVVGILEGSDPQLGNEYLVFSAHMDHLGVGPPDAKGDSIYNGADDDASGTAAVLELAQAFAQLEPRPRRSLIFLTVSGEERGLWGSSYFTAHPPVPIGQMVADLNEDMVGRNWKDTIVAIGRQHSDLGATLARVNAAHSELQMTAIDDIWPRERFYFRSDHYNFAKRGVPILFFFNGTHPDYHQPSDEPAKIDAEKESRIIQLVFYLGLEVANAPQRPKWNPESFKEIVQPR